MTDSNPTRKRIAEEAARLILRGKVADSATARKRAARWLKQSRLTAEDMPSHAEIQAQMFALTGVFSRERDPAALREFRRQALQFGESLAPFNLFVKGALVDGRIVSGAEWEFIVTVREPGLISAALTSKGETVERRSVQTDHGEQWEWRGRAPSPWTVTLTEPPDEAWSLTELQQVVATDLSSAEWSQDAEGPTSAELYMAYRAFLEPLARVTMPIDEHPEGDALDHVLQVFELGRQIDEYDEEFLLACLLHDVGWAIEPRRAHEAGIEALGSLISPRTRQLLEALPAAHQYLETGHCPKSLRKSPDFETLINLARCDQEGRVPGQPTATLDEALEYLLQLSEDCEGEFED